VVQVVLHAPVALQVVVQPPRSQRETLQVEPAALQSE